MGLLIYIKTTLRNLYSTLLPNLSIFVIIPIFIGLFMGILSQENEKSPLDLKPLKIEILDKDKTEKSKALIKYLEGQKEFLEISKGNEENILIIPKGFKDDIKSSLILKVKEESIQQKNLETLIYEYMDKNEDNTSYIEENIIKTDKKQGKENLYPAFNIFNRNKLFAQLAHNFICKVVASFFKTFTKNKSVKFNNIEFTRNQLFDSLFWVLNKLLFYQTSLSH